MNDQIRSYNDPFFRTPLIAEKNPKYAMTAVGEAETARKLCRGFSNSAFYNLGDFPYLYFTAGVTEGINHFLTGQSTQVKKNEYKYVQTFNTVGLDPRESFFCSYPFSGTGRFEEMSDHPNTILDCSYMFSSHMKHSKTVEKNVSAVLFGVSKSHNLWDLRIGWMFSRNKILHFHKLQYDYGYISYLILPVMKLISQATPNYLYNKYKDEYSKIYQKFNLIEPDTNLFGINSSGERIPIHTLIK